MLLGVVQDPVAVNLVVEDPVGVDVFFEGAVGVDVDVKCFVHPRSHSCWGG